MATIVYLRDGFVDAVEARVSLFDRGYLLGDSIFETLRVYDGRVFACDAHVDRLERASEATGIRIPRDRAALRVLVEAAVARSTLTTAYVRVTVSRGEGGVGLGTIGCDDPTLSIIVKDFVGYPADAYDRGIDTIILQTRKVPAACLDPALKTGNYLPNVMAKRELEAKRMIEGVVLSTTGAVVSGSVSNLFFVVGDELWTPDPASGCRPGVTRETVLRVARGLGLEVNEAPVSIGALASADEVFFTNTLMECLPVRTLNGRELASARDHSMTRRLHAAYRALATKSLAANA